VAFAKGRAVNLFGLEFDQPCRDWQGNPSSSCMDELRTQVTTLVLMSATVAQIEDSVLPHFSARRAAALEAARAAARKAVGEPRELRAARQLRLAAAAPLFAEYNELFLDFAAATLFATAFPLAPLVVLANNAVDMRADLLKVRAFVRVVLALVRVVLAGIWRARNIASSLCACVRVCMRACVLACFWLHAQCWEGPESARARARCVGMRVCLIEQCGG
jgi:outer membrane murein-binding lipoprotein Lpp